MEALRVNEQVLLMTRKVKVTAADGSITIEHLQHVAFAASGGVAICRKRCVCRRNGLFTLFPFEEQLTDAEQRRYMNEE